MSCRWGHSLSVGGAEFILLPSSRNGPMMNYLSRRLLCVTLLCVAPLACSSEPADPILGSGGAAGTGGSTAAGGSGAGGGGTGGAASGAGGAGATGGASATGGAASGGAQSSGGNSASGGDSASGGAAATGGGDGSGGDGTGSGVQVYILFGQSNMWGEPLPQAQDMVENPNIEVLTRISCGNHGKNEW